MTRNEFCLVCNEHGIDPSVALESDAIRKALASRNDEKVVSILQEEF